MSWTLTANATASSIRGFAEAKPVSKPGENAL
jgi:hypothetical protein